MNCWCSDNWLLANFPLLIIWAVSIPANVALAEWNALNPIIGLVIILNKAMVLLHDIIEILHFEYVNKAEQAR